MAAAFSVAAAFSARSSAAACAARTAEATSTFWSCTATESSWVMKSPALGWDVYGCILVNKHFAIGYGPDLHRKNDA